MNRQERKAKREAEKHAALYKTTPPLTLTDAFTPRGPAVGNNPGQYAKRRHHGLSNLPRKGKTPGAFGRDKSRMSRTGG